MNRIRIQIMKLFDRRSHEYKAQKRYYKLIQQYKYTLSSKQFYRPTFRSHLTNKEILEKLLSYSQDLRAVSYTHLRAHETRHDLVCRLLLEKKKNTKK